MSAEAGFLNSGIFMAHHSLNKVQPLVAQIGRNRNLDFSRHHHNNVSMISTRPKDMSMKSKNFGM